MNKLITSALVAFGATVLLSAPAHAGGDQRTCDSRPAINIGLGLTWTFDSQPGTCGYNLKPLGSTQPIRFQGCVLRKDGSGGVKTCKTAASIASIGSDSVTLNTAKGKLVVTKSSFGGFSVAKVKN